MCKSVSTAWFHSSVNWSTRFQGHQDHLGKTYHLKFIPLMDGIGHNFKVFMLMAQKFKMLSTGRPFIFFARKWSFLLKSLLTETSLVIIRLVRWHLKDVPTNDVKGGPTLYFLLKDLLPFIIATS